jgi:hypothetical protein
MQITAPHNRPLTDNFERLRRLYDLTPELSVIVVEEDKHVAPMQRQHGALSGQGKHCLVDVTHAIETRRTLVLQQSHRCCRHTPKQTCST